MGDTLTFFITDDRHSTPTLRLLVGADVARVRELALADLRECVHHRAVEVRDGDRLVLMVWREDLLESQGPATQGEPVA